jgi:methylmalonyl-CoA mutase, N-terminal domain
MTGLLGSRPGFQEIGRLRGDELMCHNVVSISTIRNCQLLKGRRMSVPLSEDWKQWRKLYGDEAAGADQRATDGGIPLQEIYTALDTPVGALPDVQADYSGRLGLPGQLPFTRSAFPRGHLDQPWIMGQYSGYATPKQTNARIRSLLANGQRGFSIALDLPTQHGLDSDDVRALGEVGRVGVPIDTLHDMMDVLDGIDLGQVRQIRTTANAIGPIAVALFIAAAEQHGQRADSFRVLLQNDVLKEYVARGTYIFPPDKGVEFSVDVLEYCAEHLPGWEPIEFCGYHIRDAGANAVQEIGVALANGFEYLDRIVARGADIEQVARSVVMFLCSGQDIFEEVAKFRAARRLWSRLMSERYGVAGEDGRRLNLFTYTLGSPQTAQEPRNNIVRIAYQTLAAALGGVQTLATSSYDEALGLPSPEAVQLSLRTQQIAAFETGVTKVIDPLGGSYLVEHLTDEFEARVLAYIDVIAQNGGALAALQSGWLGREIDDEAYRRFVAVGNGEIPVVGVNRFVTEEVQQARVTSVLRIDPQVEAEQRARVDAVRAERDARGVADALLAVEGAARLGHNTIPPILQAVRARATVGEITDALARVWGRYDDVTGRTR